MATKRPDELRITDPRALRALAHPARQRLITELFSGEVLTATEAARLVDLTPSATSYHLRALEKWGVVERDTSSDDARERPWRSTASSISILPEAHRAAGRDLSRSSLAKWFVGMDAGLDRLAESLESGRETGMTSRGRLWVTDAELEEIKGQLDDVLKAYRGRTRRDHPEDSRAWDVYAMILPAEKA
ncbi:ArsR/SmtB family transcription factor [Knoellia sp. LjRoot47]|uniref:ArsR/SmtB family transcription factor n=1 Tax=Knoellia sp. LjRoot47 TaxID=3342330 RepID=UPI003ED0DC2D